MGVLRENREFLITDPLHNNDFPTSQGVLKVDRDGYIRTHKRDLAQEIKAREPWAIVTEHCGFYGGQRTRPVTITVNGIGNGKKSDAEMITEGWVRDGASWIKRFAKTNDEK